MDNMKTWLTPLGRLLLSSVFIWAGVGQLRDPAGSAQYFEHVHVPGGIAAVWISIIIHIVFGLALLVGFQTRIAAAILAIFCLVTAFGVHLPAGDFGNMIHFYKNLAITGGLLYVVAYGAGYLSVDGPSK
jgi:putative oxidoreductase